MEPRLKTLLCCNKIL